MPKKKAKLGAPKKKREDMRDQIHVMMDNPMIARLEKIAERQGMTRNKYAENIIVKHLDRLTGKGSI